MKFHPWRATGRADAVGADTTRLGEWIFVPGSRCLSGGTADAYVQRGDRRVSLEYCSSPLEEFLKAMDRIQADFGRRCDSTGPAVALRDRARQDDHA
ncbi:hypothetical protein GCM10020367_34050 [Streptomyces sannanensis]|uniref:Uncharacterized protein n=1 Tax=Streptomyces sannanensis TaxID=285536 RepID=A0ABP6SDE4_9ACTN